MAFEYNNDKPRHATAEDSDQYLTFSLLGETYAMDADAVREIIQNVSMTSVPLMPDFIRGVINLRGSVVPVIDLQARLGGDSSSDGKKTCIIIFDMPCEGECVEIGLLVEAVSEVVSIARRDIESRPQFGGGLRRDFIRGMSKLKERFVIILDTNKALDVNEMASLIQASVNI